MKAVLIVPGEFGGSAEVREIDRPTAGPGQVLVRVMAAGLNRGELIVLGNARSGAPMVSGAEFAGEVADVGAGVEAFRPGDRVMGQARATQAEYAAVDAGFLMRIPDAWTWTEAAAFPNVFVTAHDALVTNGRLRAGETVLVNAASSGIGTAALQIAKGLGAGKVIAVSRSRNKLDRLKDLGWDVAIATESEQFIDAVLAATDNQGADLVIDSLGAEVFEANLKAMALDGRLVSVGRLTGKAAQIDLDWVALRRLSVIGVTFRTRTPEQSLACTAAARRDLEPLLDRGALRPIVDSAFALEDVKIAHHRLRSNQQVGKIILTVNADERP